MRKEFWAYITLLLSISVGCREKELQAGDFKNYIEDPANGLRQEIEVGDAAISMQYLPGSLIGYQEASTHSERNLNRFYHDSLASAYADKSYFRLEISMAGNSLEDWQGASKFDLDKFQQYFNHNVREDLTGVSSKGDTLRPVLTVYNPLIKQEGISTVLIVFSHGQPIHPPITKIVYKAKLLRLGSTTFEFDTEAFESLPKLRY